MPQLLNLRQSPDLSAILIRQARAARGQRASTFSRLFDAIRATPVRRRPNEADCVETEVVIWPKR